MFTVYLDVIFILFLYKETEANGCVKTSQGHPIDYEATDYSTSLMDCSRKCAIKKLLFNKNFIGAFVKNTPDCYCHRNTQIYQNPVSYSILTWSIECPMPLQSYGIYLTVSTATVGAPFQFILQFEAGQVYFITNGYKFYAIKNLLTPNNMSERLIVQSVNEQTINPRDERNIVTRNSNSSVSHISLKIGDHGIVKPLWFVSVQETDQRIKVHLKQMSVVPQIKQSDVQKNINTSVDGDVASLTIGIETHEGNTADVENVFVQINNYLEAKVIEIFTGGRYLIERPEGSAIIFKIPRLFIDSKIYIRVKYQLTAKTTYLNIFNSYKNHNHGESNENNYEYYTTIKQNPVRSVVDSGMRRVVGCDCHFVFCFPSGIRENCMLYNLTTRDIIGLSAKLTNLLGVDNETCAYFFRGNIRMFIYEQNLERDVSMTQWQSLKVKSTFLASYEIDEQNPNVTMVTNSGHLFVTTKGIMTANNQLLVSWLP